MTKMMMKQYLFALFLMLSSMARAQSIDSTKSGFGIAVNSMFSNQINAIETVPTALFYSGNSQFELGTGLNLFSLKNQRTLSGQFNYKYFPNSRENKYNMYFMVSCNYTNNLKKTYYPTTNQYLFLSGGYGFQVNIADNLNLGTNLSLGSFTQSKQSENPYIRQLVTKRMFDNLGMHLSFQVHVGYQF
jgi:hypothetical protein